MKSEDNSRPAANGSVERIINPEFQAKMERFKRRMAQYAAQTTASTPPSSSPAKTPSTPPATPSGN